MQQNKLTQLNKLLTIKQLVMKKLFIGVLAIASLVACNKNEVIEQVASPAIQFENSFVDNATRAAADPSTTTENLTKFEVYGFMDEPSGVVFDAELVSGSGSNWSYANTQYWESGHTFYFGALAPVGGYTLDKSTASVNGIGTVTFTNDGETDLIYAAKSVKCDDKANMPKVALTFNHLLSKVKFSFSNALSNSNASITVNDIKITAVPKTASINLGQEDWWSTNQWTGYTDNIALDFGSTAQIAVGVNEECAQERLTFPNDAQNYNVTFSITLKYGAVVVNTYKHDVTINGVDLKIGKAYNFHATINETNIIDPDDPENPDEKLYPIEFEVTEVKDWVEGNEVTFYGDIWNGYNATQNTTLTKDVLLNGSVTISAAEFDGANYTIYANQNPTDNGMLRPKGDVTIKNVTIDANNGYWGDKGLRAIFINDGGNYTLDNITTEDVTYAINVNTKQPVTLTVTNSTLEGWSSYGTSTVASFEKVAFTTNPDAYGMLRPQGKTTMKDCSFDANFRLSLDLLENEMIFDNCTFNGVKITSENIASMISTDYYGTKPADANLDKVKFN